MAAFETFTFDIPSTNFNHMLDHQLSYRRIRIRFASWTNTIAQHRFLVITINGHTNNCIINAGGKHDCTAPFYLQRTTDVTTLYNGTNVELYDLVLDRPTSTMNVSITINVITDSGPPQYTTDITSANPVTLQVEFHKN